MLWILISAIVALIAGALLLYRFAGSIRFGADMWAGLGLSLALLGTALLLAVGLAFVFGSR